MSSTAPLRTLDADQLERFNHHLQSPETEGNVIAHLRARYGDAPFTFVDVGGGAGSFSDVLLGAFPNAQGIVLDNAEYLLAKNQPHPRKKTLHASITEITQHLAAASVDVICVNLVLHHLVAGSYVASRAMQHRAIADLVTLLKPAGCLSIIEQGFNGIAIHNLPGWMIYQATASQALKAITKRLGANTAGVGVCFLSDATWQREFAQHPTLKLQDTLAHIDAGMYGHKKLVRLALHIRTIHRVHFWLSKTT